MNNLKNKTWIDWLKIIIALDIAVVGIGLIFQQEIHLFAHILGPLTRILFGILYVALAVVLFKQVFPEHFDAMVAKKKKNDDTPQKDHLADKHVDVEDQDKKTVGEVIDGTAKKLNTFFKDRIEEAEEEFKDMTDKKDKNEKKEENDSSATESKEQKQDAENTETESKDAKKEGEEGTEPTKKEA